MGVAQLKNGVHDSGVESRAGSAIVAGGACAGCLAVYAVLTALDGLARSILIVPLAVAFFWGLAVLVGSALRVIFGENEGPKRASMLLAATGAAACAAFLLWFASSLEPHTHAVTAGLRVVAGAGIWVSVGCLLGSIFGKLPDVEMAEGD
jgi:CBS domain containing-hemolysin-like protein